MPSMAETNTAAMNRSLRTIRTELEYLADSSIITTTQLTNFLSQLPQQTLVHAPLHSSPRDSETLSSPQANLPPPTSSANLSNLSLNEKNPASINNTGFYTPTPMSVPGPPPPSYSFPTPLATASALYAYNPSDAGDLALQPNDRISVLEFMNADWAKGRNERTGQEGIFPRSYVNIVENKNINYNTGTSPVAPTNSGYGNMPMEMSQNGSNNGPAAPSAAGGMGKKFGKKLGNAAIFGAGATMGADLVNAIL